MRKLALILYTFIFFAGSFAYSINFSRVNVAWQYDRNFDIKMDHRVVEDENRVIVFIKVLSDSLKGWNFEYLVQNGYESETHRLIQIPNVDTLFSENDGTLLRVSLPELTENLLVIKFSKPEQFYYYPIDLRIGSLSFPNIYPVDEKGLPVTNKYINRSGSMWRGNDSFFAMQYLEQFPLPDPPMAKMKPLAPQVDLDSNFVFNGRSQFEEKKFYTIRRDSLASVGVTILRTPPYFPEFRQLEELVESMLYIASEPEKKSILNSKNLKKSFDSFWLNTYSTKSRARIAIRKYYDSVRNANSLFTDFKEGWKTDRGMMYIVFGRPDEVYRTGSSEEWYYDNGNAFEFTIISSFFAPKTYTLRRSKDFEELWFNQITTIRRGI